MLTRAFIVALAVLCGLEAVVIKHQEDQIDWLLMLPSAPPLTWQASQPQIVLPSPPPPPLVVTKDVIVVDPLVAKKTHEALAIANEYNVDIVLARQVVDLAYKYGQDTFPKPEDILAVIAVESSFNPHACSQLKSDPACGLMQVRPVVWGLRRKNLSTPNEQILHGVRILSQYYDDLHSKSKALEAYNVGMTAYKQGQRNSAYVRKVFRAKRRLMLDAEGETLYAASNVE